MRVPKTIRLLYPKRPPTKNRIRVKDRPVRLRAARRAAIPGYPWLQAITHRTTAQLELHLAGFKPMFSCSCALTGRRFTLWPEETREDAIWITRHRLNEKPRTTVAAAIKSAASGFQGIGWKRPLRWSRRLP